jgi:fatty acid desaturase
MLRACAQGVKANAGFDPIGEKASRAIFDSAPQGARNYSLVGPESKAAVDKGLASGPWFVPRIDRKILRKLTQRDDWHAARDTMLLIVIIIATGCASLLFWRAERHALFALSFWVYCTFYTSSADSRWHEFGHGTAFRTRWLNDMCYEVASFMVFRQPLLWRFSHARHHTDTEIVGRDPEIHGRPLSLLGLLLAFFSQQSLAAEARKLWRHARGEMSAEERSYVPPSELPNVFRKARIWLGVYAAVVASACYWRSPLPMMYVFLPYTLGAWHLVMMGVIQHVGLEQDVLDHRLNSRTCYINPVSAFIYWNMQYHVEHHMFPQVPYYNLPFFRRFLSFFLFLFHFLFFFFSSPTSETKPNCSACCAVN